MPVHQASTPPDGATQAAYQQALLLARPRWQTLGFVLIGLVLSFAAPAIGLCGSLQQSGIVWAITGATLATGLAYCGAGWLVERRWREHRVVSDLLLAGVILMAAGLLWAELAVQTGPARERTLDVWPSLAIVLVAAFAGVVLMHRPAARLAFSLRR
jgi:drug/metabolite transporter (DMT)-like permease